jgi:hypothetical protein
MMTRKIFLSSFNLYKGGSLSIYKTIANELIKSASVVELGNYIFLQEFGGNSHAYYLRYPSKIGNIFYRVIIEQILVPLLGFYKSCDKLVMCGNFPVLLWFGEQSILFQNSLLIESDNIGIKFLLEKSFFNLLVFLKKPIFLVNTEILAQNLRNKFGSKIRVNVIGAPYPLNDVDLDFYHKARSASKKFNSKGFYPALYYPHKNHNLLFSIKEELCVMGVNLMLTISQSDLQNNEKGLDAFELLGKLNKKQVCECYAQSDFLIFPSVSEALGLPLLEACQLNLPVIAPNLGYVKQAISQYYDFDINSPESLLMAVNSCIKDIKAGAPKIPQSKVCVSNEQYFMNIIN